MKSDRETAIERLLRDKKARRAGEPGDDPCLDAETLAAWMDGTLTRDERRAAEAHASICARCQAMLAAVAATQPASPAQSWWRVHTFAWLAPLTAAATAAALVWAVLPFRQQTSVPAASTVTAPAPPPAAPAAQTAPVPAPRDAALQPPARPVAGANALRKSDAAAQRQPSSPVAANAETAQKKLSSADARRERDVASLADKKESERQEQVTQRRDEQPKLSESKAKDGPAGQSTRAAVAPAPMAASSMARIEARGFAASGREIVIVSRAAANSRWTIAANGAVLRSADGGATWQPQQTGVSVTLTAGSSPSPAVCWLVGPAGIVVVSTDGVSWRRVAAPDAVDLVAVTATDEKSVVVTSAAGQKYATSDGGQTWRRQG